MSDFEQAVVIYAGDSANNPERDYIVFGGTSTIEDRDYLVLYDLVLAGISSTVELSSTVTDIVYFQWTTLGTLEAQTSTTELGSSSVAAWVTSTSAAALGGGPARLFRLMVMTPEPGEVAIDSGTSGEIGLFFFNYSFDLLTSVVHVGSSNVNIQGYTAVRVTSSSAALTYTLRICQLETSLIKIGYFNFTPGSSAIQVTSNTATLTLFEWFLRDSLEPIASLIIVGSSTINQWRLQTSAITIKDNTARIFYLYIVKSIPSDVRITSSPNTYGTIFYAGAIFAQSSTIEISSTELLRVPTSAVQISSPQANLVWSPRAWRLGSSSIVVGNLNLGFGELLLESSTTGFYSRKIASHLAGTVDISSVNALLSNPYLVGLQSTINVSGAYTRLRIVPIGNLPAIAPTKRAFSPPSYNINKIRTLAGPNTSRMLCSKSSSATLQLDYEYLPDEEAEFVLQAYAASLGSQYGFFLPNAVLSGADNELLVFLKLADTGQDWFFSDKPRTESVMKGISSLSVTLQTRPKV